MLSDISKQRLTSFYVNYHQKHLFSLYWNKNTHFENSSNASRTRWNENRNVADFPSTCYFHQTHRINTVKVRVQCEVAELPGQIYGAITVCTVKVRPTSPTAVWSHRYMNTSDKLQLFHLPLQYTPVPTNTLFIFCEYRILVLRSVFHPSALSLSCSPRLFFFFFIVMKFNSPPRPNPLPRVQPHPHCRSCFRWAGKNVFRVFVWHVISAPV